MIEVQREVRRITQRRDGCTYRTEYVERRWIPLIPEPPARPDGDPDLVWASINDPAEQTIRTTNGNPNHHKDNQPTDTQH